MGAQLRSASWASLAEPIEAKCGVTLVKKPCHLEWPCASQLVSKVCCPYVGRISMHRCMAATPANSPSPNQNAAYGVLRTALLTALPALPARHALPSSGPPSITQRGNGRSRRPGSRTCFQSSSRHPAETAVYNHGHISLCVVLDRVLDSRTAILAPHKSTPGALS